MKLVFFCHRHSLPYGLSSVTFEHRRRDRIMDYYSYIISSRWRDSPARLAELKASGFRCRICNASEAEAQLQVHHRSYERLGNEQVCDLTTLCADCHCMVTDMLRR